MATGHALAKCAVLDPLERRLDLPDLQQPRFAEMLEHLVAFALRRPILEIGRHRLVEIMLDLRQPVIERAQSRHKALLKRLCIDHAPRMAWAHANALIVVKPDRLAAARSRRAQR